MKQKIRITAAVAALLLSPIDVVNADDALAHADHMQEEELMPIFGFVEANQETGVIGGCYEYVAWFLDGETPELQD